MNFSSLQGWLERASTLITDLVTNKDTVATKLTELETKVNEMSSNPPIMPGMTAEEALAFGVVREDVATLKNQFETLQGGLNSLTQQVQENLTLLQQVKADVDAMKQAGVDVGNLPQLPG